MLTLRYDYNFHLFRILAYSVYISTTFGRSIGVKWKWLKWLFVPFYSDIESFCIGIISKTYVLNGIFKLIVVKLTRIEQYSVQYFLTEHTWTYLILFDRIVAFFAWYHKEKFMNLTKISDRTTVPNSWSTIFVYIIWVRLEVYFWKTVITRMNSYT